MLAESCLLPDSILAVCLLYWSVTGKAAKEEGYKRKDMRNNILHLSKYSDFFYFLFQ